MRKRMYGKLLTISLPQQLYDLVKLFSEHYELSMGDVVRKSLDYSVGYYRNWLGPNEEFPGVTKGRSCEDNDSKIEMEGGDLNE